MASQTYPYACVCTVGDLLRGRFDSPEDGERAAGSEQTKTLVIPEYQRPYRWTGKNVRALIDDIRRAKDKKKGPYRIGSVIVHRDGQADCRNWNIVDGQQRIITFLLLSLALQEHKSLQDDRQGIDDLPEKDVRAETIKTLDEICDSQICKVPDKKTTCAHIHSNYAVIKRVLDGVRDKPKDVLSFAHFFLTQCEVVLIQTAQLDEAFQMFDSQNTRGKALEPTDLLKAIHLRAIEGRDESELRNIVRKWENIPSQDLSDMFREYLYRITCWSRGERSMRNPRDEIVEMFRGIKSDDSNGWTRIYRERAGGRTWKSDDTDGWACICLGHSEHGQCCIKADGYPFQIGQPFVQGELFFSMTAHYYRLCQRLGIYNKSDEKGVQYRGRDAGSEAVAKDFESIAYGGRNAFTRQLFNAVVLHYADHFRIGDVKEIAHAVMAYASTMRLGRQALTFQAREKYIQERNLLRSIARSTTTEDIGPLWNGSLSSRMDDIRKEARWRDPLLFAVLKRFFANESYQDIVGLRFDNLTFKDLVEQYVGILRGTMGSQDVDAIRGEVRAILSEQGVIARDEPGKQTWEVEGCADGGQTTTQKIRKIVEQALAAKQE